MTTPATTLDATARAIAADLAYALGHPESAPHMADHIRDHLRPVFAERDALLHMLVRLATESRRPGGPLYATVAEALTLVTSIDGGGPGDEPDEPTDPYDEPPGGEGGGA